MQKKVAIIKVDDKPVDVLEIKDVTPQEYYAIKKECEKNKKEQLQKEKERDAKIENLELTIRFLKGDISKEEYDRLCQTK